MLATGDPELAQRLRAYRAAQTAAVAERPSEIDPAVVSPGARREPRPAPRSAFSAAYQPHDGARRRPPRHRTAVLAPEAEAPAADVAWRHWQAAYDDAEALAEFLAVVDVVTLEWENVPVSALTAIAAQRPTRPGAEVLRITQDRLLEKSFVAGLDVPVAPFVAVDDARHSRLASIGRSPAVLKTRRFGYDGEGGSAGRKAATEAFDRLGGEA